MKYIFLVLVFIVLIGCGGKEEPIEIDCSGGICPIPEEYQQEG